MMVESITGKREENGQAPTQFVPPGRGQEILSCYAVASIRRKGVSKEQAASVMAVLIWLIKHANPNTGRCDPGIRKLAFETGLVQSTVKCAIKVAEDIGYLSIEKRFGRTSAYHLQFDVMEADFHKIEEQAKTLPRKNVTNVTRTHPADASGTPQPTRRLPTQSSARLQKHKGESVELNAYHEMVRQPAAVGTTPFSLIYENQLLETQITTSPHSESQQKGFQEEKVINLSANPTRDARARVASYLGPFERRYVFTETIEEAVAAELEAEGSGRAIVSKAANEAWRKRRNTA